MSNHGEGTHQGALIASHGFPVDFAGRKNLETPLVEGRITVSCTFADQNHGFLQHNMVMGQYLLIPCLGNEHPFTSYFDVHQGYKVLTHCHMSLKLTDWFQAKPYLWHTFGWLKWRVMSSKSTLMGPSNDYWTSSAFLVLACVVHRWRWGWRWDGDKNWVQANHDQPIANPWPSPSQVRAFDPVSATAVCQDEPGACDDQGDRDYFRHCTLPRVAISI